MRERKTFRVNKQNSRQNNKTVTIEHLKGLITKAHMSGTFHVKTYVPELKYFTELLPIAIPNVMSTKPSKIPNRRASEIAIQGVREWLRKNEINNFTVKYGEKSLTKFDLYVEIDWSRSAFRKKKQNVNKNKKKIIGNLGIECSICYETQPGTALIPCGHLFCWDCCTHDNLKQCPICKTSPLFAQRLFLP